MRTPGQRFWKRAPVARLFDAGWTLDVISRGSETDHYRCPLCFFLFGGDQELSLGDYRFPVTLIEEGSSREGGSRPELMLLTVASGFVL